MVAVPGCTVCGSSPEPGSSCSPWHICRTCREHQVPESPTVVVDGSYGPRYRGQGEAVAGAGLVLVDADTMLVIATRQCSFFCLSPTESEVEAVRRGALWVPRAPVVTDCQTVVERLRRDGIDVTWLAKHERQQWHHHIAHALSVRGRMRRSDRSGSY